MKKIFALLILLPFAAVALDPQTITPAGTTAKSAQAVQGVTNGVPMPVSGTVTATVPNPLPVSAPSLPLPAGAATSALQSTINTTLGTPMQATGGTVGLVAGTAAIGGVTGTTVDGTGTPGNPITDSGTALADGAQPAQCTAGKVCSHATDLDHRIFVRTDSAGRWNCNTATGSTEVTCQANPGVGKSLHITGFTVSASAAITIGISIGSNANCASNESVVWGPHYFAANTGATVTKTQPIDVTANYYVCCKPSGANGICTIEGYTDTP